MRRWVVVLAVVGCVCAAGCGSTSTGAAGSGPANDSVLGMLRLVPAGADLLTVNLYQQAATRSGVPALSSNADIATVTRYFAQLQQRAGVSGSDMTQQSAMLTCTSQDGVDLTAVRADVTAGDPPNDTLAALGRFDTAAIDRGTHGDPAWHSALSTVQYDGATMYRWLGDNQFDAARGDTGIFSQVPQSRRLAVVNGSALLLTRNDATMHRALDTATNKSGSAAGDADMAAVATELDRQHAYAAMITTRQPSVSDLVRSGSPAQAAAVRQRLAGQLLKPYRLAGVGVTQLNGKPAMIVALANVDDATAQANAAALTAAVRHGLSLRDNQKWSDLLAIDDVHTDGTLTVATFTETTNAGLWSRIIEDDDSLLMRS
jgi:hypothetical protein